jgi:hypothetical protein
MSHKMTWVLVTGGRSYNDWHLVKLTLNRLHAQKPITKIIHGGCRFTKDPPQYYRGADGLADRWARSKHIEVDVHEAKWSEGRSAGPKRNYIMITTSRPDYVVAFPGGKGTADAIRKADAAGLTVLKFGWDG